MNQDICVLLTPSGLLPLVFDGLTQRVRPRKCYQSSLWASNTRVLPFDTTLLSPTGPSHKLADFTPENIIVDILSLIDGHVRDNTRQLLFFILRPLSSSADVHVDKVITISIPTIGCHPTDAVTDFLPTLSQVGHSPENRDQESYSWMALDKKTDLRSM